MSIGFIGLGKLGLPCAEVMAQKGHEVNGYDIDSTIVTNRVNKKESIEDAVKDATIVFVAVPTPHSPEYGGSEPTGHLPPKDFDYSIAVDVIKEVDSYMTDRQILVLISTVLPGTVRSHIVPQIKNAKFLYNPYLIAMGTVAWDMVNPEMVMIGSENGEDSLEVGELIYFYHGILENEPRIVVGTWDECECIKVFYNTFISTKLSLVNMIQDVAQKQGNINVDVVTKALADSTHRIMSPAYMKAGFGDGGACHPRDNIALRYMAENLGLGYDMFDAIMNARDIQAENMAKEIVKYGQYVTFTSDSYKAGVEYTDGSPSLLVQHYVKEHGGRITGVSPDVVVRVHANDDVSDFSPQCVIFDPHRTYVSSHADQLVVHYGNTRK
jgi:UDPglucose 6-dehydrogenase